MAENSSENLSHDDFKKWSAELNSESTTIQNLCRDLGNLAIFGSGGPGLHPNTDFDAPEDEFGLPQLPHHASRTEQELVDLRWDSVLLDYPYTPPRLRGMKLPWAFILPHRAQKLRQGQSYRDSEINQYVKEWEAFGFSPEAYALLCSSVRGAVEYLRIAYKSEAQQAAISRRLDELNIDLESRNLARWNLNPEQWSRLPNLLTRVRPSVAVKWIIYMDDRDNQG